MKIHVIGTRGFPGIQGGVELHCERLYKRLSDSCEFVIYRRLPYLNQELKGCTFNNISFIDLPSTKIPGFEAIIHTFLATCHCIFNGAKIVHIHNIGPAFFAPLLKIFGIKTVLTYHSPNYEHAKWNRLAKKILKKSESIAFKYCDHIIFVNNNQRSLFKEIEFKSSYIPNGIEVQPKVNTTTSLDSIGVTRYSYILCVGRLTQEKAFEDIIEAYSPADLNIKLVIVGGADHQSPYVQRLIKKGEQKGVIFYGLANQSELAELYSHARLFVISSHNEGFPLVLLEAMNYSLNIIASDIPGNRQVPINNDSYYPVGNIEVLKSKLATQIKTPLMEQQYDLSKYNWDNIAQKTYDAIRRVL